MAKGEKTVKVVNKGGPGAFVFLMTYIGALVYFINKADGAGEVFLSFLQALVWPALLIYRVFTVLHI